MMRFLKNQDPTSQQLNKPVLNDEGIPIVLSKEPLGPYLNDCDADDDRQSLVVQFVGNHMASLIKVVLRELDDEDFRRLSTSQTTERQNAKELLQSYIIHAPFSPPKNSSSPRGKQQAAADPLLRVMSSLYSGLEGCQLVHPSTAKDIKDLTFAATGKDYPRASRAVATVVEPMLMHSVIRFLSVDPAFSAAVLNVFGAVAMTPVPEALDGDSLQNTVVSMDRGQTGNKKWLELNFPLYLCEYITVAMANLDGEPYFNFLVDLLKRSTSEHVGPIVDAFMAESPINKLVDAVAEGCEASVQPGPAIFPLAAQAVDVVETMVLVISNSLPPVKTYHDYVSCVSCYYPVAAMIKALPRLMAVLNWTPSGNSSPSTALRVGRVRCKLVSLTAALLEMNRREVDNAIIESGFFGALLQILNKYPNHSVLVSTTFNLLSRIVDRDFDEGHMLDHVLKEGFVTHLISWTELQQCTLRSHAAMFSAVPEVKAPEIAAKFVAADAAWTTKAEELDEFVQKAFQLNITGGDFAEKGSATSVPDAVHLPIMNPMNVELKVKMRPISPISPRMRNLDRGRAAKQEKAKQEEGNTNGSFGEPSNEPTSPVEGHDSELKDVNWKGNAEPSNTEEDTVTPPQPKDADHTSNDHLTDAVDSPMKKRQAFPEEPPTTSAEEAVTAPESGPSEGTDEKAEEQPEEEEQDDETSPSEDVAESTEDATSSRHVDPTDDSGAANEDQPEEGPSETVKESQETESQESAEGEEPPAPEVDAEKES